MTWKAVLHFAPGRTGPKDKDNKGQNSKDECRSSCRRWQLRVQGARQGKNTSTEFETTR